MLKVLRTGDQEAKTQHTTFTHDVMGRFVCNTWDEAVGNGGPPFDVVVIGAGMFGAYFAEKVYRQSQKRVLVLDAGALLVTEHIQNLARLGIGYGDAVLHDPGEARDYVWGLPWRTNVASPGLAYCIGGRSLYWGGWAPRLTEADLAHWPAEVAQYFRMNYARVESEIGVTPSTDFISGALHTALEQCVRQRLGAVTGLEQVEEAPLAVQGQAPASGLFSFDKFSSAPLLIDAIREASQVADRDRRLFLVPRAHVTRLQTEGDRVTAIDLFVEGARKTFALTPSACVVIASGTVESTRLALESFSTPLMGRNLMAHTRSNLTFRLPRATLRLPAAERLETSALLVRGRCPEGRFHLQLTAVGSEGTAAETAMFRMVPDIDMLDRLLSTQDSQHVVITVRTVGEMRGLSTGPADGRSFIDLSPYEYDEFGYRRAWMSLVMTPEDTSVRTAMIEAAFELAEQLANGERIEYLRNGQWQEEPYMQDDSLGSTHHEAGTLFMGARADASVTDLHGRFHHVQNGYVVGPALFVTGGSASPALQALTLALRTAAAVAARP
jgi:choline dehydrogenase-like flavoprotein